MVLTDVTEATIVETSETVRTVTSSTSSKMMSKGSPIKRMTLSRPPVNTLFMLRSWVVIASVVAVFEVIDATRPCHEIIVRGGQEVNSQRAFI